MNVEYKIIKLVNGENIICKMNAIDLSDEYEISSPLQIHTFPQMTKHGPVESCNLTHWVQPFSEESEFYIKSSSILLIAPASPGISRYYEQVLRHFDKWDKEILGEEASEEYFEEESEESLEEILEDYSPYRNKSIH